MLPGYYVVRTYSGITARKTLWRVLSRRFTARIYAEDWMRFEMSLVKNKKHQFAVVEIL